MRKNNHVPSGTGIQTHNHTLVKVVNLIPT